ncbi:hypothetical protein BD410DRAFT_280664 [Rickenella mellea]|uniref:F-box domain-containing protein n=1 Tax=Rickenella mellea TaxID=50990 RepID=A0A4Y7Q317_9AGAM|nr:hypothetical protein BD410DRAFT_280664 [Rickenella mellea]
MAQRESDCRRRLFCSNEVLVEIFRYSSPWDLLELQATCWLFRQLLISKPSVWRDARSRLSPPVPDPVVPIDEDLGRFSRNWSEIAYATLIFGERECAFCQNVINDALPMGSYALRQFHCGKRTASKILKGITFASLPSIRTPMDCLVSKPTFHMLKQLP